MPLFIVSGPVRLFAALAGLVLAATAAPVAAAPAGAPPALTRYYATMPFRETPFSPIVGAHPISAEDAKTRKHFRFDYDSKERPVRVAFMQGDRVVDLNDSANYYFFAPRLEIAYEPDAETRVFFDKHGNRIAAAGDVFREVYRLDERGYRRSLEFYGADGEAVENSWGVARYEWAVLDDGAVIEKRFGLDGELAELRGGFPFYEVRFHFGPNGWLALMQNYGHEGRLTLNRLNAAQDRLEFTADGDLLSWNVLDEAGARAVGNGPGVARGVIERDEYGYETVERYEDENGKPMRNAYGYGYSRSTFDEYGNYGERANYTLDGEKLLAVEGRGYAGYAYEYDKAGRNPVLITFFDEQRQPTLRTDTGYFAIRFVYDQNENQIETRYEDRNGELFDRIDTGYALIERDFDERGRAVETRFRDSAGAPVNHARDGYAAERMIYGEHGAPLSVMRFDASGRAVE